MTKNKINFQCSSCALISGYLVMTHDSLAKIEKYKGMYSTDDIDL